MATFAINETARRTQFTSTGQTSYAFNFQVNAAAEVEVFKNDTLQTLSTHYSVSLNANGTGTISFIDNSGSGGTNHTPSNGDIITIIGDLALSRTTTLNTANDITTVNLDTEFDNTVIRQQQIKEITDRSIQLKPSTPRTVTGSGTSGPLHFPYDGTVSNNANRIIKYDSNGTSLELGSTTTNIDALAAIASDISTVSGISSNVTSVAGAVSNVNTVASAISNINTVAGLNSEITSVAGVSSLITADFVSDLNTLATTDIVNDLNLLATSDFVSDLNSLATSDFVSDLNALEAIKANVTTVADNITNVSNFANRYRIASSDPTSSLDAGDLVFNTTSNVLKVYNGSNWVSVEAGIGNVVEDTTPQLGGALDAQSNNITNLGTINTHTVPGGTGTFALTSDISVTASSSTTFTNKTIAASNNTITGLVSETSATGSAEIPTGTTGQRDGSPAAGMFRFNTTTTGFEGYNGSSWGSVGGGATGSNGDETFIETDNTVTASYTLSTGKNALAIGPLSFASGVVVTIPGGQRLVVL